MTVLSVQLSNMVKAGWGLGLQLCSWPPGGRQRSPVDDPAVHHFQDDDLLRAVLQEVSHLVLQHGLGLVLGHHLQVVP